MRKPWACLTLTVALILGAGAFDFIVSAQYRIGSHGWRLPDPTLTPGVVATKDLGKICGTKWGLDRRHVTPAMKRQVCDAYGVKDCSGKKFEKDHLVAREIGGADDIRNIWAQPRGRDNEALKKDILENRLHRHVCDKTIPLKARQHRLIAVQKAIATDWTKLYDEVFGRDRQ